MLCTVRSLGLTGIEGYEVQVECFITNGLPKTEVVGLPDVAVREATDRVRAAVKNCGFQYPVSRITVNLAPAGTRKSGTLYDLPILLGILAAAGEVRLPRAESAFIGELSLEGKLRPIQGVLPMALAAREAGVEELYVPAPNAAEATLADGLKVYPVRNVAQLAAHLRGEDRITPAPLWSPAEEEGETLDFADVKGQESAKRALEVAAAGGHNVLMIGPPGSGKSMLSKRLPSILPDMTRAEALEVTNVHSVLGLLNAGAPLLTRRPFRSPHHTTSAAALAGGGGGIPKPGEISLAHQGVLFLDELPEFHRDSLEALRQPLEDGNVVISRVSGSVSYPAQFMLVCAMNPCKCGWYGDPSGRCTCSQNSVDSYRARISGPLLDRIDIIIAVPPMPFGDLNRRSPAEPSANIKKRVDAARGIQRARFGDGVVRCNARMGPRELREFCSLGNEAAELMKAAFEQMHMTARSYDRVRRVARTLADLEACKEIEPRHIAEAVRYRSSPFDSRS